MRLTITAMYNYKLEREVLAKMQSRFIETGLSCYDVERSLNLREGQFKRWINGEIGLCIGLINRIGGVMGFKVNEKKELICE